MNHYNIEILEGIIVKKVFILIFFCCLLTSCFSNKNEESSSQIYKIILTSNKEMINGDGTDIMTFRVEGIYKNGEKIDLTNYSTIYANNFKISSNFRTLTEDNYSIYAKYNDIKSNIIDIQSFHNEDFIYKGADISFLPELEDNEIKFRNLSGNEEDLIKIMKNNGINTIRLRIWVENEYCNTEETLYMAKRIREEGLNFLLDFHYSDNWADPGNQIKPTAWNKMSCVELKEKVYSYIICPLCQVLFEKK